jgi:hypothetical protein
MNNISLEFVDINGKPFERDEDGIQHVRQYKESWRVQVQGKWQGKVALRGQPPLILRRVFSTRSNEWKLPEPRTNEEQKKVTGSGYITAILVDSSDKIVSNSPEASLFITPANITQQELRDMINEIGLLALSTSSCVRWRSLTAQGEGKGVKDFGLQWHPGEGFVATATSILELEKVVKDNWNALEKRPLKSFITTVAPVIIDRMSSSPQSLIKAKIEPSKRRSLGLTSLESTQCPENEFICYILDIYLRNIAQKLIENLKQTLNDLDEDIILPEFGGLPAELHKFIRQDIKKDIDIFNESKKTQKDDIDKIKSKLSDCIKWATQARKSAFLQKVATPNTCPLPSLRLTGTPAYSAIFQKYLSCQGGVLSSITKILYLLRQTHYVQVRPTWKIYEIWCFVRLYSAFILYANMNPVTNNHSMFEFIQITNGRLQIKRDKEYKLEGSIDGSKKINVSLWYDTYLQNNQNEWIRPDIRLKLSIDGTTKHYCFDAKYRDYVEQGSEQLIEDVLGVARDKYLVEIKDKLENLSASFILHTDERVNYWGEVPFREKVDEIKEILNDDRWSITDSSDYIGRKPRKILSTLKDGTNLENSQTGGVGHQYGAIMLRPDKNPEKELKKLLRLLLQYHGSLETDCFTCGCFSESRENNSKQGKGTYCYCDQCHQFWVVQHCVGNGHRLLKFKDSFHKRDPAADAGKWMYICPVCKSSYFNS